MPVTIANNQICFPGSAIPPQNFPALVRRHLDNVPCTRDLEAQTARLVVSDFRVPLIEPFLRAVCNWGLYAGIAGRVLRRNTIDFIRQQFVAAVVFLDSTSPDVPAALREINQIVGLGRPSFASKHLRFLRPDICPILDSVISRGMGYTEDVASYGQLSDDYLKVARLVEACQQPNPMKRANGKWFASDVDMALFAHLQGWGQP